MNQLDENIKWFERGLLCALVLGAIVVASIKFEWFVSTQEKWEREAVKAGAAEYRINPTNFAKEFHFKKGPQ